MKKTHWIIFILLGSFLCLGLTQNSRENNDDSVSSKSDLIRETRTLIKQRYSGDVDDEKLLSGAVDGMLKSLDPFSEHLPQREFQEIQNEVKGKYGGVGIVVAIRGDFPRVIKVLPNSPAERAGIQEGDEIIKINGEALFRKPVFYLVEKLRGPLGSHVEVVIKERKTRKAVELRLERAQIQVESVREIRLIPPDIGYIKIVEYVKNTLEDFDRALEQLKQQGIRVLILDLRNNMGGTLEAALQIAERFLPKGALIVKTMGRRAEDQASFYANGGNSELSMPVVVLVNRLSASASEIVAGALQNNSRAKIIGESTFGKSSVQTVFSLSDGSAIRLTTAHYVTPKEHVIDQNGIQPDIPLIFPDELEQMKEMEEKKDSILDRTVEIVNAKKI